MQLAPRILIFRLSSMGDVILSTAALDAIRVRAPGAKITWVVAQEFAALLEGDPRIERLITFNRKKEGFWGWHRLLNALLLEANGFDEILDLHASLRTRYAGLLFRLYRTLGRASSHTRWRTLSKPRLRRWGYFVFKRLWPRMLRPEGTGRSGGYRARVVRFAAWGHVQAQRAVPDLSWILTHPHHIQASLSDLGEAKFRICVMPGAAWKGKCLPTSKWVRAMSAVNASCGDVKWIILGKNGEKACEHLERVARGAGIEPCAAFRTLDLLGQAQVLAGSTLLIGNDTGMIHLAEALKVPVVAVFGPTQPDLGFGPWRGQSRSVSSPLWCSPCSKDGGACFRLGKNRFQCQQEISEREIAATVQGVLSQCLEEAPARPMLVERVDSIATDPISNAYRWITRLASSVIRWGVSLKKKTRWNWRDRQWSVERPQTSTNLPRSLIWFHAASAGELEMLWPVAEELKKRQVEIALSVFSPSGSRGLERFKEEFAPLYAGPSPWEGEWQQFFETKTQGRFPSAMITAKYEAWPELWGTLAEKNIPLFVINADERKSLRVAGGWVDRIFGVGPRIHFSTVDHDARMRLESSELRRWMADSVQVLGDPRWDRVSSRIVAGSGRAAQIWEQLARFPVPRPWLVVGSSWLEDLEFLVPEWKRSQEQGLLWVVPHTIQGESFERQVRFLEQEFPEQVICSSQLNSTPLRKPRVVLVDEMGILVELYGRADAAWVGGGFRTGLHSVIEPALAGVPIGCGPKNSQSFPEVSALVATGQLRVMEQSHELQDWIRSIGASRTGERSAWSGAYQLGAGRRCGQWILEGLNLH